MVKVHSCLYTFIASHQSPNGVEITRMEKLGLIDTLSQSMPTQLRIDTSTIPGQSFGVFSSSWIKQGTKMGPFTGRIISIDEPIKHHTKFMWEVLLLMTFFTVCVLEKNKQYF